MPTQIALAAFAAESYYPRPYLAIPSRTARAVSRTSRRTVVNTLKSAALMVVLLGVLYGVYVALNKPDPPEQSDTMDGGNGSPLIEFNHSAGSSPSIGYDDPSFASSTG